MSTYFNTHPSVATESDSPRLRRQAGVLAPGALGSLRFCGFAKSSPGQNRSTHISYSSESCDICRFHRKKHSKRTGHLADGHFVVKRAFFLRRFVNRDFSRPYNSSRLEVSLQLHDGRHCDHRSGLSVATTLVQGAPFVEGVVPTTHPVETGGGTRRAADLLVSA